VRVFDIARFAWRSLSGYRTRTLLMMVAMSIGVGAVVVLTSLGEGARQYVRNQFLSLGSNLIFVFPGRAETAGGMPGVLIGRTPRDLTLEDALSLRRVRGVKRVAPLNVGTTDVSWKDRRREVPVLGTTWEFQQMRNFTLAQGVFLTHDDPRDAVPVAVIGSKVRTELFGPNPPLGEWIRIGDRRFRVVGVLAPQGQSLGLDTDELVILPVASTQALFNLASLLRIAVEANSREEMDAVREGVRRMLTARHDGEEDITVITQDAVLATFDRILVALTLSVAGIASISLGVAGILIMNVMLIAVSQRTTEIGLLKAIGASPRQIRALFFAEAILLSAVGAAFGLLIGQAGSLVIRKMYPVLPAVAPLWAVLAAVATAVGAGVIFSLLPARRAARLEPAMALSRR
jgi:putative ABC transport system permease protein